MKRVVSVSLGSSKRDFSVEAEFRGERIRIERIGVRNLAEFEAKLRELDGQVDAIGLGGCDRYLYSAGKRYTFRDIDRIARQVRQTPVVDGSGLKNTLERRTIEYLDEKGIIAFAKSRVLLVSAVDRFGMAEVLHRKGGPVIYGDVIFALGLPVPIRSWRTLRFLATTLLPIIVRMPFPWLYPTGERQEKSVPKFEKFYHWADVIAGDFHYIKKHLPADLSGKAIVTNTTTKEDVEALRERGARLLVTTTITLSGRSVGTNVLEGVLIALSGKKEMSAAEYAEEFEKIGWEPTVTELAPAGMAQV